MNIVKLTELRCLPRTGHAPFLAVRYHLEGHCLASRAFAEWCQTVIPKDGNFCPYRTAMTDTFSCKPPFIYFVNKHNVGFVIVCRNVAHVARADRRELTAYLSRGAVKWYLQKYNNQVSLCSRTFDQSRYYPYPTIYIIATEIAGNYLFPWKDVNWLTRSIIYKEVKGENIKNIK